MRSRIAIGAVLLLLNGGCGGDDPKDDETRPACIELPTSECNSAYEPEFHRVFDETLQKKCSQTNSCHNSQGRQGGLAFTDRDESYSLLLGQNGGKARVIPGDASCSELIVRTHAAGKPWQMPPGPSLSDLELCALRQWVERGAQPAPQ